MSNTTVATCLAQDWSFNSRGQSPCVVGSALAGVCVGGQFTLAPLAPDFVYLGPSAANANACRCSSVYYSLLSACANCQGRDFIKWSAYEANCSTVYVGVFPQPIPSTVSVPNWAYLNVEEGDTFNITEAIAAGGVESTALPSSTGTSSSSSSGPSASAAAGHSASKTNTGAIAGGVVGGIVVLALLCLLVFFLLRRKRQSKVPPSVLYGPDSVTSASSPPPMSYGGGGTYATVPTPKIYDPNDPTTWPTNQNNSNSYSPPPPTNYPNNGYVPQTFTGNSSATAYTNAAPRYTGVPEL